MKNIEIGTEFQKFVFSPECGGFPSRLSVTESDGSQLTLWDVKVPFLSLKTADGTTLRPVLQGRSAARKIREGSAKILEFPRIPWIDPATGALHPDLYLSLRWEFHETGTTFCDLYLLYSSLQVPALRDFKLEIPLDFGAFDDLRWALVPFPKAVDATIIQASPPERFLPRAESRTLEHELFTDVNFNAVRTNGPSLYCELFLEGNNSLFNGDAPSHASSVRSKGKKMFPAWNFQTTPRCSSGRPLHWRNRWGFTIRPAQNRRVHAPMSIYHYIDNFERCPDKAQIEALAQAGAQLLILHDCWRLDTQNNGIPYDAQKFRTAIRELHKHGIRAAVYGRGNEISVRETAAAWFDSLLKKDFDGLYLDYGSPMGYAVAADENYPGGRIAYREYYRAFERLRERVGKKGLLYVHTGTGYSAIAAGFFDGYVSGEGERGILIKGRKEHEYFTMAAASPGTIWSAAFPEYGSEKMIPFLAADGEAPHIPLGKQILSSSLEHPPVPGINDRNFAPLLYCYSLLGNGTGFGFHTDYNSRGIFENEKDAAHTLLTVPDGSYGIFLLANCTGRKIHAAFRLKSPAFARKYHFYGIPGFPDPAKVKSLEPWQVVCALAAQDADIAKKVLAKHPRRDCTVSAAGKAYLAEVEKQRKFRNDPPETHRCMLSVAIPSRITSHEQSLWLDLYNIVIRLREICRDGSYRELGYVSRTGLEQRVPSEKTRLLPGEVSAGIDLQKLLKPGKHELVLYSEHQGLKEPFYSFLTATLSEDGTERTVRFQNELEADRSMLHWKIFLKR